MAGKKIQGYEMLIEFDNGKVGCLTSISYNLEREIIDTSCREMGNFTGGAKGRLSGSIDFDGLMIIDNPEVAANLRAGDFMDMMLDDTDTPVNYVFGPGIVTDAVGDDVAGLGAPGSIDGSKVLSGKAILSSLTYSGDQDGFATYSGAFTLTTKPTHAAVA